MCDDLSNIVLFPIEIVYEDGRVATSCINILFSAGGHLFIDSQLSYDRYFLIEFCIPIAFNTKY